MTPQEAVAECRRAHDAEAPGWVVPLLVYLDELPDEARVFDWACRCVGGLLDFQGNASGELKTALRLACRQAAEGVGFETIEEVAWGLWVRRTEKDTSITAVAQLLFALSRVDRSERRLFIRSCAKPIHLLERMESRSGEVLDRVVSDFLDYVSDGHV